MSDPLANRAENLHQTLLHMEQEAAEEDLFALGYMIPQIALVMELADYDPTDVIAEDFDATYWQWLESAFAEDSMTVEDRARIEELWNRARERCAA